MNILPFILIFFLLFSYTATQMTKKSYLTQVTHKALASYLSLQREEIEKSEIRQFTKLEKKVKKNPGKNNPSKIFYSVRKKPSEHAKFNIHSPLSSNNVLEEQLFKKLIDTHYKHAPFYRESLASELLSLLKKTYTKKPCESLLSLQVDHPDYNNIWYTMQKGCKNYTAKKVSWPPLSTLFTLDPTRKALCFHRASIELLETTFSREITQAILEEEQSIYFNPDEKRKLSVLKKEELVTLLEKFNLNDSENLLSIMQFHYPKKKKHIKTFIDHTTQIEIRR